MERSQSKDLRSLENELGTSRTEGRALTNCVIFTSPGLKKKVASYYHIFAGFLRLYESQFQLSQVVNALINYRKI